VRAAEERRCALSALPLDTYRAIHPAFSDDIFSVFDFARSAATRHITGATAPEAVREQIKYAKECLTR